MDIPATPQEEDSFRPCQCRASVFDYLEVSLHGTGFFCAALSSLL